jgi:type IV pilus assembly protein PilP
MGKICKISWLLVIGFVSCAGWEMGLAQELPTPSQKTKEAIEKFSQTPAAVGKKFQDLKDTARAKLQETLGEKREPGAKSEPRNLGLAQQKTESTPAAGVAATGTRDPFRPMTLKPKAGSQPRENLSPLERLELGQLKIVGIVWDIKEPRAMIEDRAGLGYSVKIGTPIGSNEGRVKAIYRSEVVVEEFYVDFYGAKKKRDVSMKLPTE